MRPMGPLLDEKKGKRELFNQTTQMGAMGRRSLEGGTVRIGPATIKQGRQLPSRVRVGERKLPKATIQTRQTTKNRAVHQLEIGEGIQIGILRETGA